MFERLFQGFTFVLLQVTYRVSGFIDKNNDLLFRDLSRAMFSCQHPFLKLLFPEGEFGAVTTLPATSFTYPRPPHVHIPPPVARSATLVCDLCVALVVVFVLKITLYTAFIHYLIWRYVIMQCEVT